LDGGTTYTNNYSYNNCRKVFHLKYEISAKANGFLTDFLVYEIPFTIKIPESPHMLVTLHEYSGNCNPCSGKGLLITEETQFAVYTSRKNYEKVNIILKCENNLSATMESLYVFKLAFMDNHLKRYSKTMVFGCKRL